MPFFAANWKMDAFDSDVPLDGGLKYKNNIVILTFVLLQFTFNIINHCTTYGKNIWNGVAITPYFLGSRVASQIVFCKHLVVSSPILLEISAFMKLNTLLFAMSWFRIPLLSWLLAPLGFVKKIGTTKANTVAMNTNAPKITCKISKH